MFGKTILTISFAIVCLTSNSQEVEPLLFSDTSIIEVELRYNFDELKRDYDNDPNYHSAELSYKNIWGGMSKIDVEIKTRGIFRRNPANCAQPPLMIRFNPSDVRNTPFEGIGKLKLVLQCYERSQYETLLLKEYLVYKLYNTISDSSYRVRLIKITQTDNWSDRKISMYGFFIEPAEKLASRLNFTIDDRKNIHPNACNKSVATLLSVFQYMIGQTDWSIKALHNITLLEPDIAAPPIPIPFDFDFSGFVNSPYALPAEHLPIKSVTERYFNGYCRSFEDYKASLDVFNIKKNKIYNQINSFSLLDEKNRTKLIEYIDDFYNIISNDNKVKREFVDRCRTD